MMIRAQRNAVTQFIRGAALRSTALSTAWSYLVAASLVLSVGSAAFAEVSASAKVPLPKPRPIARSAVSKQADAKAGATDWKKTEAEIKAKIEAENARAGKTEAGKTETSKAEAKLEAKAEQIEKPAGPASGRNTVRTTASLGAPMPINPVLAPATRQHAALPPAADRTPVIPGAIAATSSTPQSDADTLENVMQLVRKHQPADATQAEAAISDPLAQKL